MINLFKVLQIRDIYGFGALFILLLEGGVT